MAIEEISSRIANKCFPFNKAEVAQLVEQPIRNRQVGGSSPPLGSIYSVHFNQLMRSVFSFSVLDFVICPNSAPFRARPDRHFFMPCRAR